MAGEISVAHVKERSKDHRQICRDSASELAVLGGFQTKSGQPVRYDVIRELKHLLQNWAAK